jgi:hypothetical protein
MRIMLVILFSYGSVFAVEAGFANRLAWPTAKELNWSMYIVRIGVALCAWVILYAKLLFVG